MGGGSGSQAARNGNHRDYNSTRVHSTIRCSPAMTAGVTKELMDLGGMVDVLEK